MTVSAVVAAATVAAMQTAAAESAAVKSPLGLPMAGIEKVQPAAKVVSEAPLQRALTLGSCNDNNTTCFGHFPLVAAGERWLIQFVSCTIDAAKTSTFRNFSAQVADAKGTKLLASHYIAPTYQSNRDNGIGVYVASQPMVLTVGPNTILYMVASSVGAVAGGRCYVSGLRQKLG
jgi:hypothetical protein